MSHINKAYLDGEIAENGNGIEVSRSNEPTVIYKETGKSASKWKIGLAIIVVLLVLALVAVAVLAYLYVDKKNDSGDDKTGSEKVTSGIGGTDQPGTVTGGNGPVTGTKEPVTGSTPPTTSPTPPPPLTDYRLPTSLKPLHYDVTIRPFLNYTDPKDFHFTGSVRLLMECKSATDKVTLHINVLKVVNSSIDFYGEEPLGSDPSYVDWEEDKARQFIIFNLDKSTQVGRKYVIAMNFTSPLTDDLRGLYYSWYTNKQKEWKYLATTQFQATDARKAFPCMDEPALKATFNVTLVRPTDKFSLSNMPILTTSQSWTEGANRSYVSDVFQQTPVMSTYLLAFVVCDFTYLETSRNGVRFRTYARKEATHNSNYALIVGEHILDFFGSTLFQIPYPLTKLDMIAIPDFASGAMENWGLVTYRESALLYELGVSSESDKRTVSEIVAHELAHQWFGNLVTPAWWDDIWLNEGFASYLSYLGVDYIYPGYKMFETFITDVVQSSMTSDSFVSSHPVYANATNPNDIGAIFDDIAYKKGGSIMRMMRHFMGEETFRKGLKSFLLSKQYGVATHNDLWASLTEQSKIDGTNIDVKSIMDTWILQMNYPVVMVTRDANNDGILKVTQNRFLIDPNATDPGIYKSPYGYRWTIPFTFTTSRNPNFLDSDSRNGIRWINKEEGEKVFDVGATNLPPASDRRGWVLANVRVNGYYRVNYDVENWEALAAQLRTDHTVIPAINRAQMINDAWNLVSSGDVDIRVPLLLTSYLNNETDYVPWQASLVQLNYVQDMLAFTSLKGAFSTFMRLSTQKAYALLGHRSRDSDSSVEHVEKLTRSLIASYACAAGNVDCIRDIKALFDAWLRNSTENPIAPSMKTTVYCNGIMHGGTREWEFLLKKYTESDSNEGLRQIAGLACSKEPWILNMYLKMILEENSPIHKQDGGFVLYYVASHPIGNPLAWNFFRANYDKLVQQMGFQAIWSYVISNIPNAYNTQFQLEEFKAFFKSKENNHGSQLGKRSAEIAIERIQSNISWMKKNLPIMEDWLSEASYVNYL